MSSSFSSYIHTDIYTHIHTLFSYHFLLYDTYMHIYICTHAHAHIYSYILLSCLSKSSVAYTHTYIHTYIHTFVHHIHIYTATHCSHYTCIYTYVRLHTAHPTHAHAHTNTTQYSPCSHFPQNHHLLFVFACTKRRGGKNLWILSVPESCMYICMYACMYQPCGSKFMDFFGT
jgi:hypothetical protein